MDRVFLRLGLNPREVTDNVLAGHDATGTTALSGPIPFSGNDLARTGVALILQEAVAAMGDEIKPDVLTRLALRLVETVAQEGLTTQAEIIMLDGAALASAFATDGTPFLLDRQ